MAASNQYYLYRGRFIDVSLGLRSIGRSTGMIAIGCVNLLAIPLNGRRTWNKTENHAPRRIRPHCLVSFHCSPLVPTGCYLSPRQGGCSFAASFTQPVGAEVFSCSNRQRCSFAASFAQPVGAEVFSCSNRQRCSFAASFA